LVRVELRDLREKCSFVVHSWIIMANRAGQYNADSGLNIVGAASVRHRARNDCGTASRGRPNAICAGWGYSAEVKTNGSTS
jgi:hypothetical protein